MQRIRLSKDLNAPIFFAGVVLSAIGSSGAFAAAQSCLLVGSVRSSANQPVGGALVQIMQSGLSEVPGGINSYQTRTDESGHFTQGGIHAGLFRVEILWNGKVAKSRDGVKCSSGNRIIVDFEIEALPTSSSSNAQTGKDIQVLDVQGTPPSTAPSAAKPLSGIPDSELTEQWRRTLSSLFDLSRDVPRKGKHRAKYSVPDYGSLPVLLNTTNPPQLYGATSCKLSSSMESDYYECRFSLPDLSQAELNLAYSRVLGLVKTIFETKKSIELDPEHGTFRRTILQPRADIDVRVIRRWYPDVKNVGLELSVRRGKTFRDPPSDRSDPTVISSANNGSTSVTGGAPNSSVNSEIDRIVQSGQFSTMPQAQRIGSAGTGPASITIGNDTQYTLTLIYEGTYGQTFVIGPRITQTVVLPPGSYRVLGRLNDPNVLPFVGVESFGAGERLSTRFFVESRTF